MPGPPITSSKLATGQRSKCGTSKTLTNLDERKSRVCEEKVNFSPEERRDENQPTTR